MPLWDVGERSRGSHSPCSARALGALLSARRQGARVRQSSTFLHHEVLLPRRLTPNPPACGIEEEVEPTPPYSVTRNAMWNLKYGKILCDNSVPGIAPALTCCTLQV